MPLKTNDKRKAIILLVVLALLTLFAIVGVSFVLYAGSQATSARNAREAESPVTPNMDSELLFSWFLSQLIYDADDVNGVYSSMRGHSLARTMYGLNAQIDNTTNPPTYRPWGTANGQPVYNNVSYSGIGRLRFPGPGSFGDEFQLLNYTWFQTAGDPLRDPERYYVYGDPTKSRLTPTDPYPPNSFMPFNAPYTYPDLNSAFLAAVKAGPIFDQAGTTMLAPPGAVLAQSFYRRSAFGALTRTGANWRSPQGKYLILRPRPRDQKKNPNDPNEPELFPYPEDEGGDVKNLIGSPGTFYYDGQTNQFQLANNDSLWMDLGAPVMTASDGTKFKALFAPLIIDLDNRLNLNVHGNLRANGNKHHGSNRGWGPWEVNLEKVLDQGQPVPPAKMAESANLFRQINTNSTNQDSKFPTMQGRYGGKTTSPQHSIATPVTQPYGGQTAVPGTSPRYYGPVDFDGVDETSLNGKPSAAYDPTNPIPLPSAVGNLLYWFPVDVSGNVPKGYTYLDNPGERANHPLLFNYFNPQKDSTTGRYDSVFPISNMEALLRFGETNAAGMTSEMYRLLGTNFDPAVAVSSKYPSLSNAQVASMRRGTVATHSMGMDRAGVTPWAWNPNGEAQIVIPPNTQAEPIVRYNLKAGDLFPKGDSSAPQSFGPIPFPQLPTLASATATPGGSEFSAADRRSVSAALQRVDLNRYLTPYPTAAQAGVPYNSTIGSPERTQFEKAQLDRQIFAKDIYLALVVATGAYNPTVSSLGLGVDQLRANRWLAQLAVNIVDFIDSDDFMTPFDWVNGPPDGTNAFEPFTKAINLSTQLKNELPIHYVFGTEIPRVTINEVYAEYEEEAGGGPLDRVMNVWTELHNNSFNLDTAPPLLYDPADPNKGQVYLKWPGAGLPSNYRILLCYPDAHIPNPNTQGNPYLRRSDNVLGTPFKLKSNDTFPVPRTDAFKGHIHTAPQPGEAFCIVKDFPDTGPRGRIDPANGVYVGASPRTGFYLVGPKVLPGTTPPQLSHTDPLMAYKFTVPAANRPPNKGPLPTENQWYAVVLQRLACPYLPHNPVPNTHFTQPPIEPEWRSNSALPVNPYITVDYVDTFNLKESAFDPQPELQFDPFNDARATGGIPVAERFSFGRMQPFAATYKNLRAQDPQQQPPPEFKHTFFRHNGLRLTPPNKPGDGKLTVPFDWLLHLDRQVSSPTELLHVSAFKPHELLQQFITHSGTPPAVEEKYTHCAPWFDQTARLYRAFEFLYTSSRAAGVAAGGRIPGKININTVWDEEILQALADPQTSNYFTPDQVKQTFDRLLLLRKGGGAQASLYIPELADRPFLSMAAGYSMTDRGSLGDPIDTQHTGRGTGINDTFFRAGYIDQATQVEADRKWAHGGWGAKAVDKFPRLFQTSQPGGALSHDRPLDDKHPYFQNQLLDKIFNNLTTKSNVFGVWVTVGFFKVNEDSYRNGDRPVKLEAELGKAEGRNVRHRMFAIVDRTNLTFDPANPNKPGGPPIALQTSVFRPEPTNTPTNPLRFAIDGAEYDQRSLADPNDDIIFGYYEGVRWEIRGDIRNVAGEQGTALVFGYGKGASANDKTEVTPVYVKQILPPVIDPSNPNNNEPPTFTVNFPNDPAPLFQPRTNPIMVIPWRKDPVTNADIPPPQLGNPGPQSRFNPRDYPWVVRYFSIIE